MLPEFISEGFAELSGMTLQQVYDVYSNDATAGVHPEDVGYAINRLREHLNNNLDTCETIYRLRKGDRQLYLGQKTILRWSWALMANRLFMPFTMM